jgi:chromosome partitioning protein
MMLALDARPAISPTPMPHDAASQVNAPAASLPRVFAIANFKGGVGKTTLTLNLGAAWAEMGLRVLLLDLDPSGSLTRSLGINIPNEDLDAPTIYKLLGPGQRQFDAEQRAPLRSVARHLTWGTFGLDAVPANYALCRLPYTLRDDGDWGQALAEIVWNDLTHDVVVIDCPPEQNNVFTQLALRAATDVVTVVHPGNGALEGAGGMASFVKFVCRNHPLRSQRFVVNLCDARTRVSRGTIASLRRTHGSQLCQTIVYRNIRIDEAMIRCQPVTVYDPHGTSAGTVRALATELLAPQEA